MLENAWTLEWKEVEKQLGSDAAKGLTSQEARSRLEKYGPNKLKERKKVSPLVIFANQFKNFLIALLVVATVISAAIGHVVDAIVILAIVVMNAILGFVQEYRAERAIEALERMSAPKARVIRDGKETNIPARDIVPGDVIILEQGDMVPADARLVAALTTMVDESALTGESVPVIKQVEAIKAQDILVAERKNLLFMNTIVTNGRARAIVVGTGMDTEIGKIAKLIGGAEEKETPLQKKMKVVARDIGFLVLGISAVIFGLGVLRGIAAVEMFLTAIALAVAAVPEGLPAIITITLAIGLERLAKSKAIMRRLPSVETLGSTTFICSDKTGTLTKNEMTVKRIYVGGKTIEVSGEGYAPEGEFLSAGKKVDILKDPSGELLIRTATLCNGANLYKDDKGWHITGDPTEAALLVMAGKAGVRKEELVNKLPFVSELSFDAKRKRMTTIHRVKGENVAFVKGAPDVLVERCTKSLSGGKVRKLTQAEKKDILDANEKMASAALRVLGLAYRPLPKAMKKYTAEGVERDLVWIGLVGMIDPPRPEVKDALRLCTQAGIKVAMITGDHKNTATAIGKELGLLHSTLIIDGEELDAMSDEELESKAEDIAVYARVSPEHKVRIVNALKKRGHVVAMTGDGVNDAPALKNADIGVAMGIAGTDVAKEASDMILEDDNFATIVAAVKEGRGIFENIRKSIAYLLSGNIGEVSIIFTALLAGLPLPLIAIQILWINLVTDGLPALALSVDPIQTGVMDRPPRRLKESPFKGLRPFLLEYPLIMFAGTMAIFYTTFQAHGLVVAQSIAFTTVVFFEIFQAFSCRSLDRPISSIRPAMSKYLALAAASSIGLQLAILNIPFLEAIFHVSSPTLVQWAMILGLGSFGFIYLEAYKALTSRKIRKSNL